MRENSTEEIREIFSMIVSSIQEMKDLDEVFHGNVQTGDLILAFFERRFDFDAIKSGKLPLPSIDNVGIVYETPWPKKDSNDEHFFALFDDGSVSSSMNTIFRGFKFFRKKTQL